MSLPLHIINLFLCIRGRMNIIWNVTEYVLFEHLHSKIPEMRYQTGSLLINHQLMTSDNPDWYPFISTLLLIPKNHLPLMDISISLKSFPICSFELLTMKNIRRRGKTWSSFHIVEYKWQIISEYMQELRGERILL